MLAYKSVRLFPIAYLTLASLSSGQIITTIAGGGWRAFPSGTIPASNAPLGTPAGVIADTRGNIYAADSYSNIVVRISPAGTVNVIAGNGNAGYGGDGGPATRASLSFPAGLALDAAGNLYIADFNNSVIRKLTGGTITTVAGTGVAGFTGDGGPAISARLNHPFSVAFDSAGNLYIADQFNNRIREVSAGVIKTIAGNGGTSFGGDGGPATSASLENPKGVALDPSGNVYIADTEHDLIRKVSGGILTTIAGAGVAGFSGDGGQATSARLNSPIGITIDSKGNLFIADTDNNRIREISGGIINTVAGAGRAGFSGDGGAPTAAVLDNPYGVALDGAGNLFIADWANGRVRKVSGGTISTIAGAGRGAYFGDGGPATSAGLLNPVNVAVDSQGNIYIADTDNNCIREVSGGIITTVAGNGIAGFSGDNGPATAASLSTPESVAVDASGNIYIGDGNYRVRKVSSGIITTVVGNGTEGFSGDGGPATSAMITIADALAFDKAGNLYIADASNNRVRMVSGGIINTIAGNGKADSTGDGGPATSAALYDPQRLAFDAAGNLYIADTMNNRIRKVSGGTITTIAGIGLAGFSGDGGQAVNAMLNTPKGLAFDSAGNLLVADTDNERVRRISGGIISTVVGTGASHGVLGDGGPASHAVLDVPAGLTIDGSGNLYIADTGNYRIREVLNAPPSYQVSPVSLTFSATTGGKAPSKQTLGLSSSVSGLGFTASVSTGASWLDVTPSAGSMPAQLQVSIDPSSLAAGSYQAAITISASNAMPSTTTVNVALTVRSASPPQLSVSPQQLSFTAIESTAAQSLQVQIANAGGGTLSFTAAVSTASGANWLSVSQSSGTASSASPASLTVTADPSSLNAGTYAGALLISSAGATMSVPVTLSITAPTASILLSQIGLSFATEAQGGAPLPQSFGILNTGQGSMNWTATANTVSGGNWLAISPVAGTVVQPNLDVANITVSINPTSLAAGTYYGQIQISAPAVNSPQLATVVLTVFPAGTTPGPEVRPTGLIFTGTAGVSPGSQDVLVGNPKPQTDSYLSANIGPGFTYLPTAASVPPNQPTTLRVFPDFSQLQPGEIDRGTIALQFSDGTPRTVSLLIVVAPTPTSDVRLGPLTSASCSKSNLEIQWQSPMQNFPAIVGQPTTVQVQVIDDCGNLIGANNPQSASVTATFSNQDSSIKLTHIGNGVWSGTWRPVHSVTGSVIVSVTAFNSTGSVLQSGQQSITGSLSSGSNPIVTAGGVVHAASDEAGVPIAPGSLITLYGSNLSDSAAQSSTLPLPQQESGTQVLLGNLPLPILYTSTGQVNVQVPFATPVNTQYQITVQRDSMLSVPEQLVIASAQPGVFTVNEQGTGQGVIFKSDGVTLAQPGTPANSGETVVIYSTGLGAVSPVVPDGTPAPPSPLSNTVNLVTVTIGGQNAAVAFSGLTPGFPGLYQVNAVVPDGVSGDAVPLTINVAGQTSPIVTLAVEAPAGN